MSSCELVVGLIGKGMEPDATVAGSGVSLSFIDSSKSSGSSRMRDMVSTKIAEPSFLQEKAERFQLWLRGNLHKSYR